MNKVNFRGKKLEGLLLSSHTLPNFPYDFFHRSPSSFGNFDFSSQNHSFSFLHWLVKIFSILSMSISLRNFQVSSSKFKNLHFWEFLQSGKSWTKKSFMLNFTFKTEEMLQLCKNNDLKLWLGKINCQILQASLVLERFAIEMCTLKARSFFENLSWMI